MNNIEKLSLNIIRFALNSDLQVSCNISPDEYECIYQELKQQVVLPLVGKVIMNLEGVPDSIREQWRKDVIYQLFCYSRYEHVQEDIVKAFFDQCIPFVILKGSAAGIYYPHPEYRVMGDIDIMTKREDIESACNVLEDLGYDHLIIENDFGRTIKYVKGSYEVEIHRYFASLNDPRMAEYLDDLILDNICAKRTYLPDSINGLVLLEHIGDHLEHGLGLRQIIDWMMYVRKCLDDTEWEQHFRRHAEEIGLKKLAITVTKMCQLYLGLEETITWCKEADFETCSMLMEYIMASGNFGLKSGQNIQKRATIEVMTNNHSFFELIGKLQQYGKINWKLLEKHKYLTPFAWIYEIGYSINKRIKNKISVGEVVSEYREAQVRKMLFNNLGVKQYTKGLAVLQDDHFVVVAPDKKTEN